MKEIVLKKKKSPFSKFPSRCCCGKPLLAGGPAPRPVSHQGITRATKTTPLLGGFPLLVMASAIIQEHGPYSHIFSGAEDWGRVAGLHSVLINKEKQLVLSSSLSELI